VILEIHKVKFTGKKLPEKELNYLYNLSDAHMFMTDNEGWGLGLTESLMAGRMIIAPVQGGMQDQMRFEDENGDWINFSTEHGHQMQMVNIKNVVNGQCQCSLKHVQ
jgi:glycosyltransferase involved in cell wall biosynthesis